MRALADVGRGIGTTASARTCCSAAARRPPAAGTSPRSWPTPLEAVHRRRLPATRGLDRRRARSCTGCSTRCSPTPRARRRPRLEDQPAGADRRARARRAGVRRHRERPGPREDLHRRGAGRRRGLRQRHAAAARRKPSRGRRERLARDCRRRSRPTADSARLSRGARAPRGRDRPARARALGGRAHRRRGRGRATRARCAGTSAGAADFAARLTGRTLGPRPRRGKYLWLPLADEPASQRCSRHLGMSGQLLVQRPGRRPDETHLRVRLRFTDGGRELRFVDQRTFGGLRRRTAADDDPPGTGRARSRTSPATRSTPRFDDAAFAAALRAPPHRASSGRCSTRR